MGTNNTTTSSGPLYLNLQVKGLNAADWTEGGSSTFYYSPTNFLQFKIAVVNNSNQTINNIQVAIHYPYYLTLVYNPNNSSTLSSWVIPQLAPGQAQVFESAAQLGGASYFPVGQPFTGTVTATATSDAGSASDSVTFYVNGVPAQTAYVTTPAPTSAPPVAAAPTTYVPPASAPTTAVIPNQPPNTGAPSIYSITFFIVVLIVFALIVNYLARPRYPSP